MNSMNAKWDSLCYKLGRQGETTLINGEGITNSGRFYYKVGQLCIMQSGGKSSFKVRQVVYYKVG